MEWTVQATQAASPSVHKGGLWLSYLKSILNRYETIHRINPYDEISLGPWFQSILSWLHPMPHSLYSVHIGISNQCISQLTGLWYYILQWTLRCVGDNQIKVHLLKGLAAKFDCQGADVCFVFPLGQLWHNYFLQTGIFISSSNATAWLIIFWDFASLTCPNGQFRVCSFHITWNSVQYIFSVLI